MGNVICRDVAGQQHRTRVLGEVDLAVIQLEAFVLAQLDGGFPRSLDGGAVNDFNKKGWYGWDCNREKDSGLHMLFDSV